MALISDFLRYKVKNILIAVFASIGLMTNIFFGGLSNMGGYIFAILLPALLLFVLFALRMLGAGDIKLFCAVGAIMGTFFVLTSILYSFLCGGIIAFFIMLLKRNFKQRALYLVSYLKESFLTMSLKSYTNFDDKADGSKFRFSIAIACGCLIELIFVIADRS